ncbi:hypothetical protein BKA70DRAFT_1433775 [Coprinopsis sp. MPI-PUGE-AT-0042]|nr:hypothetical protein BKA70DRAFT_1433775 [Coprinopsis sp. MPI-PUGE-AT-0042]
MTIRTATEIWPVAALTDKEVYMLYGLCFRGFFLGIHVYLAFINSLIFMHKARTQPSLLIRFIITTVVTLALTLTICIVDLFMFIHARKDTEWPRIVSLSALCCLVIFTDGFLVFRCWCLYKQKSIAAAAVPGGILLTSAALNVAAASIAASHGSLEDLYTILDIAFPTHFAATLIATAIIVYRIWRCSSISQQAGLPPPLNGIDLADMVRIIVESTSVYAALQGIFLVLYFLRSPAQVVAYGALIPCIGLTLHLIFVRTSLGQLFTPYREQPATPNVIFNNPIVHPGTFSLTDTSHHSLPLTERISAHEAQVIASESISHGSSGENPGPSGVIRSPESLETISTCGPYEYRQDIPDKDETPAL